MIKNQNISLIAPLLLLSMLLAFGMALALMPYEAYADCYYGSSEDPPSSNTCDTESEARYYAELYYSGEDCDIWLEEEAGWWYVDCGGFF